MKISSNQSIIQMSAKNAPVAYVDSGSVVCFETLDCFSGNLKTERDLMHLVGWEQINPATGPLYVNGAKPGDVLRVEIQDIQLGPQGVIAAGPNMGVLGDILTEERTKIVPIVDGQVVFNDKLRIPVSPMIGVIGTAPATEEILNGTPGPHGSNMDCKLIGAGTVLYLPVNVEGALLSMGDLHAVMGDGEIVICGVEIDGEITVKVDVLTNFEAPLPMLQTQDKIVAIVSAPTLDEAAKAVTHDMARFMEKQLGMDIYEAGMLLSVACDLCICQMVDPLMTVRMELPKWIAEQYGFQMP